MYNQRETKKVKAKYFLLAAVALSSFSAAFSSSAMNVVIKIITEAVKFNVLQQNMFLTLYVLAAAMFLVPSGKLSDIKGRKKFFSWGVAIFSIFSIIIGSLLNRTLLLLCRFLQGVGISLYFSTSLALLSSAFPPRNRGLVFGVNVTSVYTGLSLGPFLGSVIAKYWSWRAIFYISGILGIVVIFLIQAFVKQEWRAEQPTKIDYLGILLYCSTLFTLIYGFRQIASYIGWILIGLSALLATGFILWEKRTAYPILNVKIFANNRYFTLSFLTALLFYTGTHALGFSLGLYLQYYKGYSTIFAGLILLPQPVLQAIFSPVAGRFSDIKEKRIIVSIGLLLVTFGLGMLLFLFTEDSIALIIFSLCIIGIGYAFFSSPNSNAIMSSINRKLFGVGSALIATARTVGQTLSFGISTLISVIIIGEIEVTDPNYVGLLIKALKIVFFILFAFIVLSLTSSILRGKEKEGF